MCFYISVFVCVFCLFALVCVCICVVFSICCILCEIKLPIHIPHRSIKFHQNQYMMVEQSCSQTNRQTDKQGNKHLPQYSCWPRASRDQSCYQWRQTGSGLDHADSPGSGTHLSSCRATGMSWRTSRRRLEYSSRLRGRKLLRDSGSVPDPLCPRSDKNTLTQLVVIHTQTTLHLQTIVHGAITCSSQFCHLF